jgi:exosortase D (VPLPA-CTERM-specific)
MTVEYSRELSGVLENTSGQRRVLGSWWSVAAFLTVCLIFTCLSGRAGLVNLYERWTYEDEYGYGFLVAALVPLLLWRRWHIIRSLATDTKWPGLVLVAVAQLLGVFGALGESYFLEQIGFVLTLLGLMIVVFGTGPIREIVPLAILLLLTLPLPYTLQAMLTVKLQLISTNLGVAIIDLLGIPVFVEGNIIDLGPFKLQVAEACSGLRYLLPLTCLSFLFAYFYRGAFWKRAVVVGSGVVVAIVINGLRLAITAVLVDNFGTKMAEGFLHEFEGWIIFQVGALLLAVEILALEGFRTSNIKFEWTADRPASSAAAQPRISLNGKALAAIIVCAGALAITTSITSAYSVAPATVRESFITFPRQIGEWSGREGQLEPEVIDALKATDYYVGDFSEAGNRSAVNFFVAYYDSLNKGGAIHSPRVCLPGAGWEFASFEEKDFRELAPETLGTFNRVVIQKGEQKMLMYYWFQQREHRTANEFTMKYYLLADSLKKYRKDGALVRILTPIASGGERGAGEADARLHGFAKALLPKLGSYLPQ